MLYKISFSNKDLILLLKKMKNPNWDWEGERRFFVMDEDNTKQDVDNTLIRDSIVTGIPLQGMKTEKIFRNHPDSTI